MSESISFTEPEILSFDDDESIVEIRFRSSQNEPFYSEYTAIVPTGVASIASTYEILRGRAQAACGRVRGSTQCAVFVTDGW